MKKYLISLVAILTACASGEERQIEAVAFDYCMATSYYDMDAAEPLCTPESAEKTLQMARYLLQYVDSAYIASDSPVEITIKKTKQQTDTTAYVVYHKHTPIKDFTDTLRLRKRDGRWLVHTL